MANRLKEIILMMSVASSVVLSQLLNESHGQVTNQSNAIVWADCKKEVVSGKHYYGFKTPLRQLSSESLSHVTLRTANNRTEYLHMRFGLLASFVARIVISPEQYAGDNTFFFYIIIDKEHTELYAAHETGFVDWKKLAYVQTSTALSERKPAPLLLTISDDTLQLRQGSEAPFLEYRDERLGDVKYFGFSGWNNDGNPATIYYDC